MEQLAPKLNPLEISLCYGKIAGIGSEGFAVEVDGMTLGAERSLNCLVEPETDDLVLISRDTFGRAYIIAILERRGRNVKLSFEGDVSLCASSGRLSAAAAAGIDLLSPGEIRVCSGSLNLDADQAEAKVGKVRLVGETVEYIFDRLTSHLRNSYRRIVGLDQKEAGGLNYQVKNMLNLRSRFSAITSEEVVRVDAEKILMG